MAERVTSLFGGHIECNSNIKMTPLCQIEMTLPWGFRGVVGVTIRLMSDRELGRLEVLQDMDRRRLTTAAAGQLLGLERRQVFRLLKAYRIEGPTGLISKRRGRQMVRCVCYIIPDRSVIVVVVEAEAGAAGLAGFAADRQVGAHLDLHRDLACRWRQTLADADRDPWRDVFP